MFAFTVGVAWCKLPAAFAAIAVLSTLNLRGAKESIKILMPIFLLFIVMHVVLIFGTMGVYADEVPLLAQEVGGNFTSGMGSLGMAGMAALLLRAYSMGAGTYTGIEAVSNGFQIMREPRVQTATRTMVYMAVSLAVTTVGITLCYLLVRAEPAAGKTMNAVLTERFAQAAKLGPAFVIVTLFSEAALLFVAAQAGFIAGPRVMANMAGFLCRTDSPRFRPADDARRCLADLRASLLTVFYTRGNTHLLAHVLDHRLYHVCPGSAGHAAILVGE